MQNKLIIEVITEDELPKAIDADGLDTLVDSISNVFGEFRSVEFYNYERDEVVDLTDEGKAKKMVDFIKKQIGEKEEVSDGGNYKTKS